MAYDEFSKKCEELRELAEEFRSEDLPEQPTRNAFISPFLGELGYDVSNLRAVRTEYDAGFAGATAEKVDYAILDGEGKPMILVEAKRLNTKLDIRNARQLSYYFNNTNARVGILTNGTIYEVYLDKVKENVMDGESFFTFNLSNTDGLASHVIFKLARLEDGSFDQTGFEEAVENWRITTEVKPKVMRFFQQWYEGSAKDLGKLLAQQLASLDDRAKDRLVSSLAAEWFKEFVDSKVQLPPIPPPPPPPPPVDLEWKPLPEWQVDTARDMPDEIRFPDLTTARIHKGYDVPIEVTRWLRKTGYLKDDHIPIRTGRGGRGNSYLVSFTKESSMLTPKDVEAEGMEPVWVATGFSAEYQVINAQNIIEKATQEPMDFSGRWRP